MNASLPCPFRPILLSGFSHCTYHCAQFPFSSQSCSSTPSVVPLLSSLHPSWCRLLNGACVQFASRLPAPELRWVLHLSALPSVLLLYQQPLPPCHALGFIFSDHSSAHFPGTPKRLPSLTDMRTLSLPSFGPGSQFLKNL